MDGIFLYVSVISTNPVSLFSMKVPFLETIDVSAFSTAFHGSDLVDELKEALVDPEVASPEALAAELTLILELDADGGIGSINDFVIKL